MERSRQGKKGRGREEGKGWDEEDWEIVNWKV